MKNLRLYIVLFMASLMVQGCACSTNEGGIRGVYFHEWGEGTDTTRVAGEGWHTYPFSQTMYQYSIRQQENIEQMEVLSSNGLSIGVEVSILYSAIEQDLPFMHIHYPDIYETAISPNFRSVVREEVGKFTPEELYSSRREELQAGVLENLQEQVYELTVNKTGRQLVDIDAILIRDVDLPASIRQSIEKKLGEEQAAQQYEFTLQKEKLEAERKRIAAEGEAAYNEILARSITPNVLRSKALDVQLELARSSSTKWVIDSPNGNVLINND